MRLIVPPLPAVSRPSNDDDDPQAVGAHRLLQQHQLLLHPLELALVGLLRRACRPPSRLLAPRVPCPGNHTSGQDSRAAERTSTRVTGEDPSTRTILRVVGVLLAVGLGLWLLWVSRSVLTWVAPRRLPGGGDQPAGQPAPEPAAPAPGALDPARLHPAWPGLLTGRRAAACAAADRRRPGADRRGPRVRATSSSSPTSCRTSTRSTTCSTASRRRPPRPSRASRARTPRSTSRRAGGERPGGAHQHRGHLLPAEPLRAPRARVDARPRPRTDAGCTSSGSPTASTG